MNPSISIQSAIALHQQGQLVQAAAIYKQLLQQQPAHPDLLHLSGLAAYQMNQPQQALTLLAKAIACAPNNAVFHVHYGNALMAVGRLAEALVSFEQALHLQADQVDALNNRGLVLYRLKRFTAALESYDQLLQLRPRFTAAWLNRGLVLQALQQFDAALKNYEQLLSIDPHSVEGHLQRGNILRMARRFDAALASFDKTLQLQPNFAEVWSNRGVVLKELGRFDEALASYDRALALKPEYVDGWYNRANLLNKMLRFTEAVESLTRLLNYAPEYPFARGQLLHAKMLCCDWEGLESLLDTINQAIQAGKKSATPFGFQAIATSEHVLQRCAEIYAADKFPSKEAALSVRSTTQHEKIRIGYVSGEFGNQATSILMVELFELHDKTQFELYAFDNGFDDHSAMRQRIQHACTQWFDIAGVADDAVAQIVRQHEIDILVNLNGYFGDGRQGVFSMRPAPIQVNYLGFPGTMGAPYIDYLIADRVVIPTTSWSFYNEKIVTLPHCYQVNDRQRQIADVALTRAQLQLPDTGIVFCCFNNNYKITPQTFAGWMRILQQTPDSVLWLLQDNAITAQHLRLAAQRHGVQMERIIFAERFPLSEHLARHQLADLFLDTLPYNAHTTASDALWAGLPLLTCMGTTFPGRVAASLLQSLQLPELITHTQAEYEARAVELALNPTQLLHIRHKLAHNRLTTALFDTPQFTRHIEVAYGQMMTRLRQQLLPDHITVQ